MRGLDEIWQVIFAICGNLHQSSGSLPNLSRNLKRVLRKKRTKTVLSIFPIWNITVCSYSLRIITRKGNYNHRSEEHTSELQSRFDLVCRLLLEKKKTTTQK